MYTVRNFKRVQLVMAQDTTITTDRQNVTVAPGQERQEKDNIINKIEHGK